MTLAIYNMFYGGLGIENGPVWSEWGYYRKNIRAKLYNFAIRVSKKNVNPNYLFEC